MACIRARGLLLALLLAAGPALAQAPAAPPSPPGPAAAAQPAGEDAAIGHLRALLGPDIQLRYGNAAVLDSAAGNIRLGDVELQTPDGRITGRALTASGLREDGAQELVLSPAAWHGNDGTLLSVDRIQLSGLALRRPAPGVPLTPASLIGAIGFDRLAIEGLAFGLGEITIGRMTLDAYGLGRPTRFQMEALEGNWGGSGFTLARASMGDLDMATLMMVQLGGGPATPARMHGTMVTEGFAMQADGETVGGAEGLRGETEVEITAEGRIIESDRAVLRGLQMNGVPMVQTLLGQLGYPALPAEITLEARYELQGARTTMHESAMTLPGFGRLAFGFDLDGLEPLAPPALAVTQMRLLGVMLGYRDDGLLPRIFQAQAAAQQVDPAEARAWIVAQVATALDDPSLAPLLAPIKRFLTGRAPALEIAARPPSPLGFADLDPGQDGIEGILARLGLAASNP